MWCMHAWAELSLFELINVANLYSLPFEEGHFTNLVNTDQTVCSFRKGEDGGFVKICFQVQ